MDNQTNSRISIRVEKRASILHSLELVELIPIERIKALIKSNYLSNCWEQDENNPHNKLIRETYPSEDKQIKSYLKNYSSTLNGVPVKYWKAKHQWGRAYPSKSLGLSCFRREVRNSLIKGLYYDFDIKNAQPSIIKNICQSNNISCPKITRYCDERDIILQEVQTAYGVNKDKAKDLFIRLCFFGTFYSWCRDHKLPNKQPLEFITDLSRELVDIAKRFKDDNDAIYQTARKKKEDKGENQENNILGSFFALYCQEYESRIMEVLLCYLINQTELMKVKGIKKPIGAYEYDGIKIWKENVDCLEGRLNGVIDFLNEKTFELTGFRLEWTAKSLDDGYNLDEWIKTISNDDVINPEFLADINEIKQTIKDSDCGVIELIMKLFPNHVIYSVSKEDGNKGEWYGWNGIRWEKSSSPLKNAIQYKVPEYWNKKMKKWNDIYENMDPNEGELDDAYKLWMNIDEALSKKITILKSNNGADNCVNNGKSLMANYNLEFDTNINLFGCENGVIDLNEECFRPYRYDDYVSFSCHYNFTPFIKGFKCWEYQKVLNQVGNNNDDEELTFIEEEELVCRAVEEKDLTPEFNNSFNFLSNTFQQIIPDDEMREYLFTILSTGLTGLAIEKFFIFNGSGRNGKGLTNEFMELVLGDYFVDVSSLIYTENQKNKSTSGANPEIAKLDKKRYCVSREPEKSTPLKNSVIKGFTGGGNLQARMLYSSKTKVLLCLTAIMECNKKPPFDEEPTGADIERIVDILFGSVFTNEDNLVDEEKNIYKVNPELKPTIKTSLIHRNTMLNILLSQLLELKKQGYNTDAFKPEIVKLRSLEYLQNSYDIHNIFTTLFEVRCEENATKYKNWKGEVEDADWTLPKVIKKIKESKEFYELPKNKKKEYKTNGDIENFFNTNLFYKSIIYKDSSSHSTKFKSWRLKLEEEEEL
jgi:phage/plasmid-associated DNA primase